MLREIGLISYVVNLFIVNDEDVVVDKKKRLSENYCNVRVNF